MLFICVAVLLAGFGALVKGAGIFVDGSAALARNFRVPGLIIGLTIVAVGTSAPELAVSITAAVQGANEIALSNVVGSNIFNLLCVLGLCALLHPVSSERAVLKRDFPLSIGITALVFLLSCGGFVFSGQVFQAGMDSSAGVVGRAEGILLIGLVIAYIAYLVIDARRHPAREEDAEKEPVWKCALFIAAGLVLIVAGGQAVVYGAKEIAGALGMSETLIGLTIVAVGTSLPELVTSVVAARKGETGLAVGNVVGSNILNLMLILGISAAIHPVAVNVASVYDLGILICASLLTFLFLLTAKSLKRPEGAVMVLLYVAHMVFAIVR